MRDSGMKRIRDITAKIGEFMRSPERKIMMDINGLTHNQVGALVFGRFPANLLKLFSFTMATLLYSSPFSRLKVIFYRMAGVSIGRNVYIAPGVYIDIMFPKLVSIGSNVIIGMGTSIVSHERTIKVLTIGRVDIGNNVAIGGLTLIRCGVKIGDGAEIDAMMNITRNLKKGERATKRRQTFDG